MGITVANEEEKDELQRLGKAWMVNVQGGWSNVTCLATWLGAWRLASQIPQTRVLNIFETPSFISCTSQPPSNTHRGIPNGQDQGEEAIAR